MRFGLLGGLPQVGLANRQSSRRLPTFLKETCKGRTLTQRVPAALLEHYGLQCCRTNPRSSHENGVAEQASIYRA